MSNNVDSFNGKGPVNTIVDYSIQPGSGGWGIVFKWQAFKTLGGDSALFFNGSYIATRRTPTTCSATTPTRRR